MASPIRVCVIGPPDNVQDVLKLTNKYPELEFVNCAYQDEENAVEIFQSIRENAGVILFTGPIPYYKVVEEVGHVLPMVYVPFTGVALYKALHYLGGKGEPSRVSIDTISKAEVTDVYNELAISCNSVHVLEYSRAIRKADFVDFHAKLYRAGITTAAITCLRSAHLELTTLGIPCIRVMAPKSSVVDTIDKVLLLGENIRTKENQIVVGTISIDIDEGEIEDLYAPKKLPEAQREIELLIKRYVEETDGYLVPSDSNYYTFFTTRGLFERSSNFLTRAPLLDHIQFDSCFNVSLGVGMGGTANQAGQLARFANILGGFDYLFLLS